MPTRNFSIRLGDELETAAKNFAANKGVSVAALIRAGVNYVIAQDWEGVDIRVYESPYYLPKLRKRQAQQRAREVLRGSR